MAIPQEIIEQVREKTDIVEVISSYIPLKKSGRNFRALCPFHSEKTPSFFVNSSRQIFHCFGCGAGGGVFQFLMQYEKVSFPEAVEMLAKRVGIAVPKRISPMDSQKVEGYKVNQDICSYYYNNLFSTKGRLALDYLRKRGIKDETIKTFKIGLALPGFRAALEYMRAKGVSVSLLERLGIVSSFRDGNFVDLFRQRIVFPICDVKSRVVGFGARRIAEDKNQPKYINTPESLLYHKGRILFGINLSKEEIVKRDYCIIVEGYLDMILPFQEGVKNITASLGTALTPEQIKIVKRYTNNVVLVFDPDNAGKISSLRAIDLMIEEGLSVKAVTLPSGTDPDSFVRDKGRDAFLSFIEKAEDFFFYKLRLLRENSDLSSPAEKAKAANEMLLTVNKFGSEVMKFEYLKRLSAVLHVDEQVLAADLNKLNRKNFRRNAWDTVSFKPKKTSFSEEYVVKSMLNEPEIIGIVKKAVSPDDFTVQYLKAIVEEIYRFFEDKGKFELNLFLSLLPDEAANKVSELTFEEFFPDENSLKESINIVRNSFRKEKKRALKEEIKKAESLNDTARLSGLMSEFEKIVKGEKQGADRQNTEDRIQRTDDREQNRG